MRWPTREERENLEIQGFIRNYLRLPNGRRLKVVEKRERPDYIVRDISTKDYFGVELTSVYLSDRSVPDEHIPAMQQKGVVEGTLFNQEELDQYEVQVVEAIRAKVAKAHEGYDTIYPLILSVYVNEYRAIFMDTDDWKYLVERNESIFDLMRPFSEVVFWSLANNDVLSVRPGSGG